MTDSPINILLVEDVASDAEIVENAFATSNLPYSLSVVRNLQEANVAVDGEKPGLIVTNLQLPDGRGTELIPHGGQSPSSPVLVLVNHGNESVSVDELKAGAIDFVVKSEELLADMPQLVERILTKPNNGIGQTQAHQNIRQKEEEYRILLDNHVDGVAVYVGSEIMYINPKACELLGYSKEEMIEQLPFQFLVPEDRERAAQRTKAVLAGGKTEITEFIVLRKDGSQLPVDVSSKRIVYGGRPALLGVIRDLTERKKAEQQIQTHREELAHVTRLSTLGELASGLAHELNQPLTGIGMYAASCEHILASLPQSPEIEKVKDILGKIQAESMRSGSIIKRLRSLVARRPPVSLPFNLNTAIRNVWDLVSVDSKQASVHAHFKLGDKLPNAKGDQIQIEQVVLNLMRNSMEAMVAGQSTQHELTVSTALTEETQIEMLLSDSGPGIPQESLEKVFEGFYTTKPNGLGLGLSISRTIVELHVGQLSIAANSEKGVTFRLVLPTEETQKE